MATGGRCKRAFVVVQNSDGSSDSSSDADGSSGLRGTPGPARLKISHQRSLPSSSKKQKNERAVPTTTTGADVTKMSLWDRLKAFPDEKLTVQKGKIYCSSYSKILNSKKSIVKQHCQSVQHKTSKAALEKSKMKVQMIAQALRKSDA